MVLTSQFKGSERFRTLSYSLAQGFVLNSAVTVGIKAAVGRERPDKSNSRSFPSGHSSNAFAFATILSHYHPKTTIPAYFAASVVAVSRLDEDVHFLSDVVAGATLGYIVGRTVVRQAKKKRQRHITWMPYYSPARDEAGVMVRVVF